MGADRKAAPDGGLEPWAKLAFVVAALVVSLFVYLGLRPGGSAPVHAYLYGTPALGLLSAALLALGIVRGLVRRPFLQRGRLSALTTLAACLWLASFPLAYPSSHEGHPSAVEFRLPFAGARTVRFGGDRRSQNVLVLNPARRFGTVFESPPSEHPWVLAPAAGHVVATSDAGITIEVAQDELLELEGCGATVAEGASVRAGDPIGAASGPLTVFLRDSHGEGIPLLFSRYVADEEEIDRGTPIRGQRVRNGASSR